SHNYGCTFSPACDHLEQELRGRHRHICHLIQHDEFIPKPTVHHPFGASIRSLTNSTAVVKPHPAALPARRHTLDLSPILRQTVKGQNSMNGEFDSWVWLDGSSHGN